MATQTPSVHLIKLCVGAASVDDLRARQRAHLDACRENGTTPRIVHKTRQTPQRRDELQTGGSIYWIIKGAVLARQALLALEDDLKDGRKCCALVLDPEIVLVRPTPKRAFQGWRYLPADDAPPDLTDEVATGIDAMPARMRQQLVELALL